VPLSFDVDGAGLLPLLHQIIPVLVTLRHAKLSGVDNTSSNVVVFASALSIDIENYVLTNVIDSHIKDLIPLWQLSGVSFCLGPDLERL
jgi:hypothetical protein